MTAPAPRVRRAEVRRRLLESAAEVFADRGYDAARLDEVARCAGFTKGAVYSNFDGKPALLAAVIEHQAAEQLSARAIEVRAQSRPESVVEDMAEVLAEEIAGGSTWSRLHVEIAQRAAHDPEVRENYLEIRRNLRDRLAGLLATGCARRGITLTVTAEQLALTLQSLRLGLALEHGTDPHQVDRAAATAVIAGTLRGAMRRDDRQ